MNKVLSSVLSLSLVAVTSAHTSIAFAANDTINCSCVSASAGNSAGKVISVAGEVLQSGKSGYSQAVAGSDISVGSLLSVGEKSAAKVSFGSSCSVLVPANSELKVSLTDNVAAPICASISSAGQKEASVTTFDTIETKYGADLPEAVSDSVLAPVTEAVTGGGFSPAYLLLGAAVLGGVGYGIFELIDDDDDDAAGASPATP
ncbi:MAG: hypothetical protein ABJN24_08360 [Hyphomicrobiales bacterium]